MGDPRAVGVLFGFIVQDQHFSRPQILSCGERRRLKLILSGEVDTRDLMGSVSRRLRPTYRRRVLARLPLSSDRISTWH